MRRYQVFDIGGNHDYTDDQKNKAIMKKISEKCYLPMNKLLLKLIKKYDGAFKISFSITGVFIDQCKKYAPEVLESFRALAKTGCVEFLCETYYHSLAYLYSKKEFKQQVEKHKKLIEKEFGKTPKVFRNTELVFNNDLAETAKDLGFDVVLAEGADHILKKKTPNVVYTVNNCKVLLKNYKLSDDIAFRFSNKDWEHYPLTPKKFVSWIDEEEGDVINLFMDYETFGEHQWEESGIFTFMESLFGALLKKHKFVTISEASKHHSKGSLNVPRFVSWADIDRDLTAWIGNQMQENAIKELYLLENPVKTSKDLALLESWRRLTTSDHFYYMCTKWFNDGDVHKYFSPYESPYEAFIAFMNILNDIIIRIKEKNIKIPTNSYIMSSLEQEAWGGF